MQADCISIKPCTIAGTRGRVKFKAVLSLTSAEVPKEKTGRAGNDDLPPLILPLPIVPRALFLFPFRLCGGESAAVESSELQQMQTEIIFKTNCKIKYVIIGFVTLLADQQTFD